MKNFRYFTTYQIGKAKKQGSYLIPFIPSVNNLNQGNKDNIIPNEELIIKCLKEILNNHIEQENKYENYTKGFAANITACDQYDIFKTLTTYHRGFIIETDIKNVAEYLWQDLNNKINYYESGLKDSNFIEYHINVWVVNLNKETLDNYNKI